MMTISETPILLAHRHWRCAERKLYAGRREEAMSELKTAIRELEKAMEMSQDSWARCSIQKQIEFHKRRVNLLATYNSPVETDDYNLLSESSAFPQDFEDFTEVAIENEEEIKAELNVCEAETGNGLLLSEQDFEPVSDPLEICQQIIIPRSVIEPCLSENQQFEAFVARIAELESENKALKESLLIEKSQKYS